MSKIKSIAAMVFMMKNTMTEAEDYAALKDMVRRITHKLIRMQYGKNVDWDKQWSKKLVYAVLASDIPMTAAARARLENNDYQNNRVELEHRYDVAIMTKDIIAAESVEAVEAILLKNDVVILTKEEHLVAGQIKKAK